MIYGSRRRNRVDVGKLIESGELIHLCGLSYVWEGAFQKIADLNTANFAGYSDWRLPNVNELHSLIVYEQYPAIDQAFNNGTDSCTLFATSMGFGQHPPFYWSSTTSQIFPDFAFGVSFNHGVVLFNNSTDKLDGGRVRAVRGP